MKTFFSSFLPALIIITLNSGMLWGQSTVATIQSPDKQIRVNLLMNESKQMLYQVFRDKTRLLESSKLGITREDADFSAGLKFLSASAPVRVSDEYQLMTGKRRNHQYIANRRILHLANSGGEPMDIIFQVSNDGLAFRYHFPAKQDGEKTITLEHTSFQFPSQARAWLQPMQVAKTGWEQTNPAYEENYQQAIDVGTAAPTAAGWVFPALFQTGNHWVLITEAAVDGQYCASRLGSASPGGEYQLAFPDPREVITGQGLLPKSSLPFSTPWRILAIGSLKTIVESTLGTDLANPAVAMDQSFLKPGKSSWSWINSKDDFIVYDEQKKYIDYAADMNWQYCLIDVNWDTRIGYEKIKELADYGASKNVGLLLWYNSAGDWNTVKYTPKNLLLTHESRVKEFSRLKEIGIKGVKIDFFAGDGQSVMKYYHDILKDAADFSLLVNFHGATLPRGLHRTFPNLVTTEAVRGFEMVTFEQADADRQANHCAMLPFTRNAFDPMDFTPMNLYKIPTRVQRKTSSAFELALSVLFTSGIQHFSESPEGMSHVPAYVKEFLRELPSAWEEIRFLDGFPGKFVVLARRAGNRWWLAGINAEANEKSVHLPLASFGKRNMHLITDGKEPLSFDSKKMSAGKSMSVSMQPSGGFVMVLE